MKFVTIFDEKTKDVIAQLGEDDNGTVTGVCADGINVIVDGELLEPEKENNGVTNSSALACSCGARASELDIVKTLTSYLSVDGLADIETEYKVVCPKCGRSGDLARSKEGAVISWNEGLIKEKFNDLQ